MKGLITLLLVLVAAVTFALLSVEDPGFVVIGRSHWSIETSLSTFALVLILGGLVIYHLISGIIGLWYWRSRLLHRRVQQQQSNAQDALVRGTLTLIQGQWQEAEQILLKTVSKGKLSVLHYLGALYAASQQPLASSRITDYFYEVQENGPQTDLVLTLFEAKLQLQQHNWLAALEKTLEARRLAPKNENVLLLLLTIYLQLADWPALLELLPELRKHKVLSTAQIQHLETRASTALILHSLRTQPAQAATFWSKIPKATRLRPEVLKVYLEHLITTSEVATAETLLRESLKYHWDSDLLAWYGELETAYPNQQLNYAESWLKVHDKDHVLLLTLGRLCLRNRLWDKAQQYLEASVYLTPLPKTYQLLAELATQKGELAQANEYYRQGLQLALQE